MLCLVPSSLRKFWKAVSMKCDPPSLITIRGVPNLGKIISWNILRACICGSTWHGFDPFGDVVYGDQDILASLGSYKRSHVINTPDIKKLDLKIVVQGHWNASCDPSMPLAVWTSTDEVLCIFIHRWPIETALPAFRLSAKYTIVTSVWCCMVFFNDLVSFCRRYTMSE